MRTPVSRSPAHVLSLLVLLLLVVAATSGCKGSPAEPAASSPSATGATAVPGASEPSTTTIPSITKSVGGDGVVTLGDLSSDGFSLVFPADAYQGVADVSARRATAASTPAMEYATPLGEGFNVDTGPVQRLDNHATLTLSYDPVATPDPMLLALAYHDGKRWSYVFAAKADETAHTVVFPVFHFSAYYPAQFKSELEAAKYYAGQMAAQKVLGEGGGSTKVASRMLADMVAEKLGLGDSEFAKRTLADIAADQDVVKLFDEAQRDGWSDTGYIMAMDKLCGKLVDKLVQNRSALDPPEGAVLTPTENALKQMGDMLKATQSGAKFLGFVMEGDMKDAGKELFNLVTDNTGLPGKALKYTLQGMQNAVDVWRDSEVEKAFEVYVHGSPGSLFGYGAVDPLNFDEVWDNMKGAARQLCLERIRTENEARAIAGMEPLSAKEEDFYREKVKQELKLEFERRVALQAKIDAHRKNLELILNEPYFNQLLEKTNVFLRNRDSLNDTLEDRLTRFNHLIERIFRDLGVSTVYTGPQLEGALNGRISSTAMAEMLRGYFVADTQAQAEEFLLSYYQKLGLLNLSGRWTGTFTITEMSVDSSAVPEGEEGCSVALGLAIMDKLQGTPIPMTMDITLTSSSAGTAVMVLDMSGLDLGEANVGQSEPMTLPFTLAGTTLTFHPETGEGATTNMQATVSLRAGQVVMNGTLTNSGSGMAIKAVWAVAQARQGATK